METLLSAQHELYGRMARTHDNLKKAGTTKIMNALIASTLKLLEAKWEKFEEQHERLRTRHWEEMRKHEYFQGDFLSQAEIVFTQQRAALLELQEELVTGQEENSMMVPAVPAPPRTTLPRIQLPHFSGKYEDWPSFRDLFVSLISRDPSISDVTRLHYLKASLKGEAELLVRSLPTTDANFARAWQVLQDYYENTRLLVRAYYSAFVAQPKLKGESATDLRKPFHCVTSTAGALESIGRPITSSEDLYVIMTVDLLDPRSRREWENHVGGTTEPPTFAELRQFLEQCLHTLEAMQPTKTEVMQGKGNDRARTARAHHAQKEKDRCTLCHRDHFIMMYEAFKKKSGDERLQFVNGSRLCLNCLGKHKVSECQSKGACSVCGARHHSTLHDACRAPAAEKGVAPIEPARTSHVARDQSESQHAVLLATAQITVADRWGILHSVRALVDQGSEISIVTEALAQRLRLPRQQASVAVFGVGEKRTATARGQVTLGISTRDGVYVMSTSAIVLPRLTVYAGLTSAASKEWPHLGSLKLADPQYSSTGEIEVLLGADVYAAIESGMRKGNPGEPVAQQTALGWIVSGPVGTTTSHVVARVHRCTVDESLSTLVRRFWEQEEVERVPTTLTPTEQECKEFYLRTHARDREGRYVVRLPVDASLPDLTASRAAAARMLSCMERRFTKDARLQKSYIEFMDQYTKLGHMSRVGPANGDKGVCYLPHHGVVKELSTTTKLRVVFNGSVGLSGGESLNKHLLVGSNLLPPLADILLRWRRHRYVADIEKMYRQIMVHPDDRNLQRILWRNTREDPVCEYQLNTVTYGLACAPFLAIRTLRQLSEDEGARYPKGAATLRDDVYVDDILTGASTLAEIREVVLQLVSICAAGGFPLQKWAANDERVLAALPDCESTRSDPCAVQLHQGHSTLGLQWHLEDDCFTFVPRTAEAKVVTKRTMLSQAA